MGGGEQGRKKQWMAKSLSAGSQRPLEDLWGLKLGWGPCGRGRRTEDRAAERPQSASGDARLLPLSHSSCFVQSVTGRRHSPAEKCGEPGAIRACGPSPPLPSSSHLHHLITHLQLNRKLGHRWLLKNRGKGENSDFTVGKPGKQDLNQVMKAHVTGMACGCPHSRM